MFVEVFNASSAQPRGNVDITGQNTALSFSPESSCGIENKANQQNQTNTAAANDRSAKIEPATAEQKKKHK